MPKSKPSEPGVSRWEPRQIASEAYTLPTTKVFAGSAAMSSMKIGSLPTSDIRRPESRLLLENRMIGVIYQPHKRRVPMALDAVSVIGQPMELARIDYIRNDGIAVCTRIGDNGEVRVVHTGDGRRFLLRGVLHYHISKLYIRDDIPLVSFPDCEWCGDPATRVEAFDRDVFTCDQCSAI